MWTRTRVTETLGIQYPIIQGPFGNGLSCVALASTVSNAGGLGSFGANGLSPIDIGRTVAELRASTDRPFNLNLWLPLEREHERTLSWTAASFQSALAILRPYFRELEIPEPPFSPAAGQNFEEQVRAAIEARPPILSFLFGVPSPELVAACRSAGILTMVAATTVDEAVALDRAGVDVIVASGSDAGGHRPSFLRPADESLVGTFSLVPQIVDAVRAPVVAAGGIADGRGLAAAFALGAGAVQIGTAFLACDESAASASYKARLTALDARVTVLTRAISGRLARGIPNRLLKELRPYENVVPPYPLQNALTLPLRRAAVAVRRADLQAVWAGQAASLTSRQPAAHYLHKLLAQADILLSPAATGLLPRTPAAIASDHIRHT